MKTTYPVVVCDHSRRTAIAVAEKNDIIQFIPLSYENGFQVKYLSGQEFAKAYPTAMADYPVEKAAVLYAQYALDIGATEDALDILAQFTTLTQKDREMATKTAKAPADKPAKKTPAAKKATAAPAAKKAAVAKADKPVKEKKAATPKEPKAPRVTASSMFRDLLVAQSKGENKFTDDQIFAKVQKAYDLDDNKRSYISWYRNDAIRKGLIKKAK